VRYLYRAALAISVIGFTSSLIVHVRSLLGFGLRDWLLPFIFILLLMGPWFLAADDIVHRDIAHWRNDPVLNAEAGLDRQILWGQLLHRSRAGWVKVMDYVIVGYFFLVFGAFFLKGFPNDPHSPTSGSYLPAHVATFFSSGWMAFYWNFFGTFWNTLKLN
jgi:hypothetical protein